MILKKRKLVTGDVFCFQVQNKWMFGKVLIDIWDLAKKKQIVIPEKTYLTFFRDCILIEVYDDIKEDFDNEINQENVIIKGEFVLNDGIKEIDCIVLRNEIVDVTLIDFPESINRRYGYYSFDKGELSFKIMEGHSVAINANCRASIMSMAMLPKACLYHRTNQSITTNSVTRYFESCDLRYQPLKRHHILNDLKIPDLPYYELALLNGLDLERYFK